MASKQLKERQLLESYYQQIDQDSLRKFISQLDSDIHSGGTQYLALSFSIPSVDPLAVIEQSPKNSFQYYWEKPIDKFGIAASGSHEQIITTGDGRYRTSSTKGKEVLKRVHHFSGVNHQNAVVHLLGGFSFFEENNSEVWNSYPSASFTLPEWMIIKEGNSTIFTIIINLPDTSFDSLSNQIENKLGNLTYICSAEDYELTAKPQAKLNMDIPQTDSGEFLKWIEMVKSAKEKIADHTFEKVVLAREMVIKLDERISDTHILNRLRGQYSDCYCFLIRQDESSSFIGCTPERLASFSSKFVLTEGLAGSTSRGKTASEDAVLEYNLLHSSKDLHEHEIVLDAIEETLVNYSDEVVHPNKPSVKKLSNVQHLYTPITARIRNGVSRTEVLKTLHPTPAVGGFPRDKAVEFIKQNEDFDRGWYASPFGWINAHGEGEFIVAIRSGLIKDDEVRFFAGCGIVEDSDPEKEWEETNLKFIPMLSALEYAGT